MTEYTARCGQHRHELVAFASRLTRSRARAEDIVQDAYIRAWHAWERWEPVNEDVDACVRNWLYRIVNNLFATEYERIKLMSKIVGESPDVVEHYCHGEVREEMLPDQCTNTWSDEIQAAIEQLSPAFRPVIERKARGDSHQEVADHLDVPLNTVCTRTARGYAQLAKSLKEYAVREWGIGKDVEEIDDSPAAGSSPPSGGEPTKVKQTTKTTASNTIQSLQLCA